MIKGLLLDNSTKEREERINKELKEARPAIITSCSDGILMVTLNNLRKPKIKQVSGPIAFVGIGIWGNFNKLWTFACASLTRHRFIDASERDFSIFDKIIEALCQEIRHKFQDLYSTDYYQCELVFAYLGNDQSQDKLCLIDCAGIENSSSTYFSIPSGTGLVQPKLGKLNETMTMREALIIAVDILNNENGTSALEVAILSRDILLEGETEGAYHKLTPEEIKSWLSQG